MLGSQRLDARAALGCHAEPGIRFPRLAEHFEGDAPQCPGVEIGAGLLLERLELGLALRGARLPEDDLQRGPLRLPRGVEIHRRRFGVHRRDLFVQFAYGGGILLVELGEFGNVLRANVRGVDEAA